MCFISVQRKGSSNNTPHTDTKNGQILSVWGGFEVSVLACPATALNGTPHVLPWTERKK